MSQDHVTRDCEMLSGAENMIGIRNVERRNRIHCVKIFCSRINPQKYLLRYTINCTENMYNMLLM